MKSRSWWWTFLDLIILVMIIAVLAVVWLKPHFVENGVSVSTSSSQSSEVLSTKKVDNLPQSKASDWQLINVSAKEPLTTNLNITTTDIDSNLVDSRIVHALSKFQKTASKAGYETVVMSGYQSVTDQQQAFDTAVANAVAAGDDETEAESEATATVGKPGTIDDNTGLGVDLAGKDAKTTYPNRSTAMDGFSSQKWLMKHAAEYGFVLRYPQGDKAEQSTGVSYQPWHFRYVGIANAHYMQAHNLTLEEYIKRLRQLR